MEEFCEKEPPTSTRTSNPHCDRLDFENDDGGSNAADQSFELSDAQDSDSEGDLEEGEIQSEADTNEEDSKFLCGVKGSSDSDINKKPHIPNFNIVKYKQSDENDSPASSSMLDSSTDQFKTESSDMAPDSYIKSDMESSDGEIYSASEDNQISEDREQSVDLYDMVFDFKSEKDQSTADSLDDTLTEDVSESVGKKRKHTDIENDHSKSQNNEAGPVAKKSKGDQATVGGSSSDGGNLQENGLTHEFDVIDETNEEGGDNYEQDVGDYDSDEDDLDDNEIYAWLEEGVNKKSVKLDDEDEGPSQREKLVLQEKGSDPFDMLPEGWVLVTHNSGMPVYLHKQSRVVTFSKPYFIGPGSVRKHNIPVSAIPCLYYRREKDREAKEKAEKEASGANSTSQNGDNTNAESTTENQSNKKSSDPSQPTLASLPVKIEYAEEREKENSLEPEELRKYCESLFEFRKITVNKFKTWKDRRRHLNNVKKQSRPALPSNTKLITCKVPTDKGDHKPRKKEFVLNPTGKSYVCILHEYAQHTLRVQPRYVFKELENAQNPYSATIIINEIEYGTGFAGSKRAAKMEAAKATLSILIPEMSKLIEKQVEEEEDLSFFDDIKIEDPRVYELCNKSGQPSPFQILLECLKRNYGLGDTQCKIDVKTLKHQKSEYTLSVGKHSVTVVCKNKREGKQSAAQAMLKQLHPHIYSLGALLRLYGRSSWKSVKEKKKEEHAITGLQSQVRSKRPNEPLLQKLKEEMMKIQMQRVKLCCKCITPKCDGFPKPDGHAKVRWSVPNPNGVTRQSPMVCTKVSWL